MTRELGEGLAAKRFPVEVTGRVRSDKNEGMGKTTIRYPLQRFTHHLKVFPRTDVGGEDQIRTIIAGALSNEGPSLGGPTRMEQLLVHAERVHVDPFGCKPVVANELLL